MTVFLYKYDQIVGVPLPLKCLYNHNQQHRDIVDLTMEAVEGDGG